MKNWKIVFGTEETKPLEIDTLSSPTTIYQRRNIEQIEEINSITNDKIKYWKREERELTLEEYSMLVLMQEIINVQKEKIIDDYTLQLIEEGVI